VILVMDEGYRAAATGRFPQHDVRFYPKSIEDADAFGEAIRPAHALALRRPLPFPFDRRVIAAANNLQFINKTGSGADWFDVPALTEAGIMAAVNTGVNAPSVAEHTVMLMLLCLRGGYGFIEPMRRGVWEREPGSHHPPSLLNGKTVGIIGLGNIGSHVARAMLGLGARVIAYQPRPRPLTPDLASVILVSLDDLLRESDIVTLHVPLTGESRAMIGPRELALMKPTAILINTSRGKVIDEGALYVALRDGKLRGAGLDVFEEEPTPADNPLLKLENVCATPHVAGAAAEITALQIEATLTNIERFLAGQRPERLVNPEVLGSDQLRARHLRAMHV
jgi:phosphoglycerate dehydrogenase-like enzyme